MRAVPRLGAIILTKKLDKVLLVESYDYRDWSFPKGKLDEGETEIECAIREIKEEINLSIDPAMISQDDYIKIEIQPELIVQLFIIDGISDSQTFKTNT